MWKYSFPEYLFYLSCLGKGVDYFSLTQDGLELGKALIKKYNLNTEGPPLINSRERMLTAFRLDVQLRILI